MTDQLLDLTSTQMLTIAEVAPALGISQRQAYRLAKAGQFPVRIHVIGSVMKVCRPQLEAFLRGES